MLTIKVDGDATGGWMAEIHDGTNFKASSPVGDHVWDVASKAVKDFHDTFPGSIPHPPAEAGHTDPPTPL